MPPCSSLLLHCDHLVSLLDLSGWTKVEEADLAELRQHMKENNVNLRLTESNERDSRWVLRVGTQGLVMNHVCRYVSLYQLCQSALKEKFPRVEGWEGER